MLLSLIIISGVLSELTLARLRIRRHLPKLVFARRPVLVTLELTNLKKRLPSFSVQVDDRLGLAAKAKRCFFLKVNPQKTQSTSYRTECSRGLYSVDRSSYALDSLFLLHQGTQERRSGRPGLRCVSCDQSTLCLTVAPDRDGGFDNGHRSR